ncbi:MAG: cohesin domain-containing protein [Terriglobia bacterium]|jgi:general secretion pathway protein D|nr:cohesin domain-containing protein [Terriglobia bacterium]
MKRLHWFGLVLLIALIAAMPALADKAKSFYEKGRDAEARQNYELAYDNYKQAYDLKPTEMRYRVAFERTKFLASASHVHKGQLLRDAGKLQDALKEFQSALAIDPSSFIAQQEIRRTEQMIKEVEQGPPPPETKSQSTIDHLLQEASGPVELAPISTQPITMQMTADAKVVYETIGKLAGINVLFDPDYSTQSRSIHIALNGVTLNQALEIVSLESKTFWRPVTPNTIFVAADTQAKRKELEQSVIRTFYLSNLSTPTEIQDVTNSLRQILEITRVQQLPSQGAIIVRGTPDQIALAQKVIDDIDKARPEVVVEVAVMQVSKDKLRQLGIQYPFSQSNNPTISIIPKGGTTSGGTSGTTGGTTTSNGLTLNDLANLDARNFAVSIPSMSLAMLLNDSTSKTLENPQIRALDGQKATLKIGSRVPVATGSFQPGIGGVGINPLVNTQFQYIDVGVNIDMTPTVHADHEVTLKMMFEISSVISTSNIGGINQPVIGSKHIEQTIRLKDGEVNLLGGLMESSDVRSVAGLPGLAQIPILKYLFGNNSKEVTDNEIVFVVVPHIVREQDITRQNERAIDVGTANAIQLRQDNTAPATRQPVPTPATPAPAPAPEQPMPQQATPPPQAEAPAPNMGPQGAGAVLSFDPPTVDQAPGTTFAVNVSVTGAQNVYSIPAQINYDPKTLELVNVSAGPFLSKDGQAVALVNRNDPTIGTLNVTATRPPGAGGVSGDGQVFTLTFMAKAAGQSNLTINRAQLRDPANQAMPASGAQAVVTVK